MVSSFLEGRIRASGVGAVVTAALLLLGVSPTHAQQGAVSGTVTDASSGEPLSGAQVFVPGSNLGTLTSEDGTYRLEGVPQGQQRVRVRLIGYSTASTTVTVSAGQVATADFQLAQTALKLQEVVVTGVAGETPQAKLPFSVEQVTIEENAPRATSMGGMLQGKVAGATVLQASGEPGSGFDIQLRGATSINASGRSQGPLIVVDGVIQGRGMDLADLNSLDIKNMEVVKGAAAASLYGSRAANGVVQITTKRGEDISQGGVSFTFRAEGGVGELPGSFDLSNATARSTNPSGCPDNCYLNASGNPTTFANAADDLEDGFPAAAGTWAVFQDNPYPESTLYDQVDRFFNPGEDYTLYGALSGNIENTNFRASSEYFSQQGIIKYEDGYERKSVRVNLDNSPTNDLDFQVSGYFADATQDQMGEGSGGSFYSLTFMPPNVDLMETDDNGDLVISPDPSQPNNPNPLYAPKNLFNTEDRQRVMGSFQTTWDPTTWFTLEANFSYDRSEELFEYREFRGYKTTDSPGGTEGYMEMARDTDEAMNARAMASYVNAFGDLTVRTRAQVLAERQNAEGFDATASTFAVSNVPSLGALTGTPNVDSYQQDIRSESYYLITNLDYKDRYIVDGLVRRDGSSLFGEDRRWHTYYRGSAAWRVSEEPWWFGGSTLSEFRLRGSYGTAGSRPSFSAQYETYGITGQGGVVPQTLGNSELEPEFSKELSVGTNMVFFDRVSVELTYAESDVDQQILNVPLPGYFGFDSQWRNAGALHSETWEASVQAPVLQTDQLSWTLNGTFSSTETTITELNVPPYRWAPPGGQAPVAFYNREGETLGTMYGTKWATSCGDLPEGWNCDRFQVNDDGLLVPVGQGNSWRDGYSEQLWGTAVSVGNGESRPWGSPVQAVNDQGEDFLPIGNSIPDANFSLGSNFSWRGLQLYGLLDASVGQTVYNQTVQWGYRDRRYGAVDQTGKPNAEKKPVAYYSTLYDVRSTNSHFAEDGSFVKLRELSLSYTLNEQLTQNIFGNVVENASLSLTGRNLVTWSDFRGYDPEVGQTGGQAGSASIARVADFDYPNFRTLTGTLQLTF